MNPQTEYTKAKFTVPKERDKWSNILDTSFESSATAKKHDSDTLNSVKEEVKDVLLQQLEGAMSHGMGVRKSEHLNNSDL